MKTLFDAIRDTANVAITFADNKFTVKMPDGKEYVGEMGFKVFDSDWTCRGMRYTVGAAHEERVNPVLCDRGLHYCPKAADCFNYYSFNSKNKVALVLAYGKINKGDDKHCTNKLLVIREIPWAELLELANDGKDNTGLRNTGNRNTGNRNTGNRNTGDGNTGDGNTGDGNTGNRNTGDGNTGDGNTGNRNFGSRCSGDFNLADGSTGVFCSEKQSFKIFDQDTNMTYEEWQQSEAYALLMDVPPENEWRSYNITSPQEDAEHPECEKNGGYVRHDTEGQRFIKWWENLCKRNRDIIKAIPNFNPEKFKKITGIDVNDSSAHTRCYQPALPELANGKIFYKVGDRVRIGFLNHYDGPFGANNEMEDLSGSIATITEVEDHAFNATPEYVCYKINLDHGRWNWSSAMFAK